MDLEAGLLRAIHDRSFVDDPTRAIRAARYASRFGMALEPHTRELLRATADSLENVGRMVRLVVGVREDLGILFESGTHAVDSTSSAGLELSW